MRSLDKNKNNKEFVQRKMNNSTAATISSTIKQRAPVFQERSSGLCDQAEDEKKERRDLTSYFGFVRNTCKAPVLSLELDVRFVSFSIDLVQQICEICVGD